jgi:predicted nucleic acid-binding protein
VQWQSIVEQQQRNLLTTRAVLCEVGNALSRPPLRAIAARFLSAIETAARVKIVEVDSSRYAKSLVLYQQHGDKDWGLIDCVSFVAMREFGVQQALTADKHFEQAGFGSLLQYDPQIIDLA